MTKDEIRELMRSKRCQVSVAKREEVSKSICERLMMRVKHARLVCCYEALKTEIDLSRFIAECPCEVIFPRKVGDRYEVERASEVDLWVCPGLAFTERGARIGFGGGWYDRFLAQAKPEAKKLGVAYRFQMMQELEQGEFDIPLDEILVEGVSLDYERALGEDVVIGVDEAGRGPLVGGVYAAAVSVPLDLAETLLRGDWRMINDSKQLSPKKRDQLAAVIKETANCRWSIAQANAKEIDELNILSATHLAMRRAVEGIGVVGKVLVDGLPVKSLVNSTNLIKGDAKSLFIAAASILAKTARDEDCLRLERLYPGYGIARHKGYPTAEHYAALAKLGPCPEHRRSFRLV